MFTQLQDEELAKVNAVIGYQYQSVCQTAVKKIDDEFSFYSEIPAILHYQT